MENWNRLFKEGTLEQGFDYFIENRVESIRLNDNTYEAVVCGTEDYEVEICVEAGEIGEMFCTCPHAASGNNCKHMAAVLYELETELDELENGVGVNSGPPGGTGDNWAQQIEGMVNNADEMTIKAYLIDVLKRNAHLAVEFEELMNEKLSSFE